jgi:hypothetical protein
MNSEQQKRLKTPTDIAQQFKELQELRLKVRRAELTATGGEHGFGNDANNGHRSQGPKMPNDNNRKS